MMALEADHVQLTLQHLATALAADKSFIVR
jgi:hypothetical protein